MIDLSRVALAVLLMLLLPSHAFSADPLKQFDITYKAETDYLTVGSARLSLASVNDSVYKLELKTEPAAYLKFSGKGIVAETAYLASLQAPFAAFRYDYFLRGSKKKSYSARIDHQRNIVHINQLNKIRELGFEGSIHDRLSVTLEMIDLLTRKPDIASIELNVLDGGKLRAMRYVNEGVATIKVPLGSFSAIQLKRKRADSNRVTTTWFAEVEKDGQTQLMPIKIEQYKKGKLSLRLVASKLSVLE